MAEKFRHESIDEMKDADELIERILYLDGVPNMQRLGLVCRRLSAREAWSRVEVEAEAIARLNTGIARGRGRRQRHPRAVREDSGEESHADWLEAQLSLIDQLGEALYLSQQIRRLSRMKS